MSHTGNPRHPNNPPSDYPQEPTGPVAKDSLAAESVQSGGGFGDNDNPEVLGVRGAQSTFNTTDTTNADILPPARSAAERDAQGETGEVGERYPDAEAGQGFGGTHSDQGYRGGASGYGSGYSSTGNTGGQTQPDEAPSYAGDLRTEGELQPKGDNLVEGGDIPPNRSTYMGDVGGPNDPGRLAEREFAKVNADASGGSGARDYGNVGSGGQGDGTAYDALDSSERA